MPKTYFIRSRSGGIIETENPEYWRDATPLKPAEARAELAAVAREGLRRLLPRGATVYCVLRSVSRSGMYRRISFFATALDHDGKPCLANLDGRIARLLSGVDSRRDKQGLGVSGCGMDMGAHVVMALSSALYESEGSDRAAYVLRHSWI